MNIVILGGGFGGLTVATRLRERLKPEHTITLVDRKPTFQMGLAKLWGLVGFRPPEEGRVELSKLVAKGIQWMPGEVRRFDPATKTFMTREKILPYDYLVVALGAETAPEKVVGLPEAANLYEAEKIPALHAQLKALTDGRVVILVCGSPYKCPPAPYEAAMLLESWFQKRNLRTRVKIHMYIPEERPLMVAGPAVGEQVKQTVEARGIKVSVSHKVTKVDPNKKKIFFENGQEAEYDVLLAVPPHRAPSAAVNAKLTDDSGWIPVDPQSLEVLSESLTPNSESRTPHGIYALGDVTCIKLPGGGFLPKAGFFAALEGEVVADRIASAIEGVAPQKSFDGKGFCFFEAGHGQAMKVQGDFFGEPSKRVVIEPPGEEAFQAKQQFERDFLQQIFG